jgi:hypothetical protein
MSAMIAATKQLDARTAGDLLYELADRRRQLGDLPAAEQALRHLALEHPRHRLAEAAWRWLVRYHGSQELSHWREAKSEEDVRLANAELPLPETPARAEQVVTGVPSFPAPAPSHAWASGKADEDPNPAAAPFDLMVMADRLQSERPALYTDPSIGFPLAAACRQLGRTAAADAILRRQLARPYPESWRALAALEMATARSLPEEDARLWTCRPTDTPPRLDGLLDEPFWHAAQEIHLAPGPPARNLPQEPGSAATRILVARDDNHLYFAAVCPKRASVSYLPPARPRPRDADVTASDRIELALDVNRDYSSAWHFTFDHRGWTAESLLDNRSWDPEYFVASRSEARRWTIEAAIPFDQLGPRPPAPGDAWAAGVSRIAPGWGFEYWHEPATPLPCPAAYGMLLFP